MLSDISLVVTLLCCYGAKGIIACLQVCVAICHDTE